MLPLSSNALVETLQVLLKGTAKLISPLLVTPCCLSLQCSTIVEVTFWTVEQKAREVYMFHVQLADGHVPRTCDGMLLFPTSPVIIAFCINPFRLRPEVMLILFKTRN